MNRILVQMTRDNIENIALTSNKVNIYMSNPHYRIMGGYVMASSNDSITVRLKKGEEPSDEDSIIKVNLDDIFRIERLE